MITTEYVSDALSRTGVSARILGPGEKQALILRLMDRHGVDVRRHEPWDDSAAPQGQLRPDGWTLIAEYVGATTCLVFLDGAKAIWKLENGGDLRRVLNECPAVEFYVCDENADYLLCSNHHDFVIGWGVAASWVENLGHS